MSGCVWWCSRIESLQVLDLDLDCDILEQFKLGEIVYHSSVPHAQSMKEV